VINCRNHRTFVEQLMFGSDLVREGHGLSQRAVAQLADQPTGVTHDDAAWTTSMSLRSPC
jgi:hypothetical protein